MKNILMLVCLLSINCFGYATLDLPYNYPGILDLKIKTQKFTGMIEPAFAIGGETTGVAMRSEEGELIELEGKDNATHKCLKSLAYERARATVTGYFITVRGVEIPERKVFVVVEIDRID